MHFRHFLIPWFFVGITLTACWGNISITPCDEDSTKNQHCKTNDECSKPETSPNSNCDSNAAGGLQNAPWPMAGGNAQHTKQSIYVGAQTNNLKWSFDRTANGVSVNIVKSATIDQNGTIYFLSGDNLHAVDSCGNLKWLFPIIDKSKNPDDCHNSIPAIAIDGTIYVGGCDGKLHAISPDGKEKWSFHAEGWLTSPAIGADNTIYFGGANMMYALDPNNHGEKKWSFAVGDGISPPVVGTDGTIYFGSKDKYIYAVAPDGKEKWSKYTGNENRISPAIGADGTIYLITVHRADNLKYDILYALDPDDGEKKLEFPVSRDEYSNWFGSEPAIGDDGTVYFESTNHILYAVDSEGKEKWSYQKGKGDWLAPSPVIGADGTVYTGGDKLYAFHPNGKLKWSSKSIRWLRATPAIGADGTVYVGSDKGKLYAFGQDE